MSADYCFLLQWTLSEQSFQNIESKTDRNKLNDFLTAGIEKSLNTQTASAYEIIETAEKYLGVPHCMAEQQ